MLHKLRNVVNVKYCFTITLLYNILQTWEPQFRLSQYYESPDWASHVCRLCTKFVTFLLRLGVFPNEIETQIRQFTTYTQLSYFYSIRIAKLYVISYLIWISILIGNRPLLTNCIVPLLLVLLLNLRPSCLLPLLYGFYLSQSDFSDDSSYKNSKTSSLLSSYTTKFSQGFFITYFYLITLYND